jgi:FADH2 O2-dependent halogenase
MIREVVDVAVLGAGFAGAVMSLILRRMGHNVALLERGTHPRFSLGESSTPLANLSLEEIARDYDLPFLHDLAEYGRWKKSYPDLVCGLKRGFTFVKHDPDRPFVPDPDHSNELLVAASPADEVGDTHWLRADFDHFLVRKAAEAGVVYLDRARLEVKHVGWSSKLAHWLLEGWCGDEWAEIKTPLVIDATGPAGALARVLGIETAPQGVMRTSSWAIYSHFEGVARWEDVYRDLGGRAEDHPYRCDDAALHHVIDEGWVWVLRFDNGVTSAGVLVEGYERRPDTSLSPEKEWSAILRRYPALAQQFAQARAVRPWERTGVLQRRARGSVGEDFVMLAPTAYSLDALYSTGNAHALHSIQRLARAIERAWDGDLFPELRRYDEALQREIDFLDLLVDGTYRAFRDSRLLSAYAMYYFAGAVAAEERRRQGRADAEEEFLSSHIPEFRVAVERAYRALCDLRVDVAAFQRQVAADIAPWNTVGLCDPRKRNMYPYG